MNTSKAKSNQTNKMGVKSILGKTVMILILFGFGFVVGNSSQTSAAGMMSSVASQFGDLDDTPAETLELDALWQAWSLLETKFVATVDLPTDKDKIEGLIRGLTASYNDPYTEFFNEAELEIFNNSVDGETFTGVGMEVGIKDGLLRVVAPLKGSPAEMAGIMSDDIIFNIDGEPSAELLIDEAISKIRGPKDTTVSLTVLRQGVQAPLVIDIVRDEIDVPVMKYEQLDEVFVISIYSFSADLNRDFREALVEYEKSDAKGLIIDLRNNPGGYLTSAVELGSWFTEPGQVLVREQVDSTNADKKGDGRVYRSKGYIGKNIQTRPLVVLVNGGSASASEIFAGIVSDYDLGTVIGQKTFGKGSVQELIPLEGGSAIKITTARWLTPAGTSISEGGLTPEIEVANDPETESDEVIERAIQEILKN